jgi:hypothetical protein
MTSGLGLVLSSLHFSRRAIQLSMIDLTEEESLVCLTEGVECAAWSLRSLEGPSFLHASRSSGKGQARLGRNFNGRKDLWKCSPGELP